MTDEPPRWVLVSRTFIAAYGTFATEQGCWDFVWARRKPAGYDDKTTLISRIQR